jgi:hypothetical protein
MLLAISALVLSLSSLLMGRRPRLSLAMSAAGGALWLAYFLPMGWPMALLGLPVAATAAASLWVGLRRAPSGASGPEPDPSPAGPGAIGADANGDVFSKKAFDGAVLKTDGTAWAWGVNHHGADKVATIGLDPASLGGDVSLTLGGGISVASGAMMPSLGALTSNPVNVTGFSGLQGTQGTNPLPHYVTHAGSGWSGASGFVSVSSFSGATGYGGPLGLSGFIPKASGASGNGYATSGYLGQATYNCQKCGKYIGQGWGYCQHCGACQKPVAMSWGNACRHKDETTDKGEDVVWLYVRKDGGCWFCSGCGKRAPEDWRPPEPPKAPTAEELNPEAGDGSRWDEI